MSTSTFSLFCNILGIIEVAISLSAFLINIGRSHLPSNKIKELEYLMDETEMFFTKTVEKGLLTEPAFIQQTHRDLSMLRTRTLDLQSQAYKATTFRQDCFELLKGTSSSIGETCGLLKGLRAKVIESSEKGSRNLMEVNSVLHTSSLPVLPCNPAPDRQDSPLPSVQIPHPSLCPPILPGWKSLYAQRAFHPRSESLESGLWHSPVSNICTDPPNDLMQSDPDVQIADTQTCVSTIYTSVTFEPRA